MVFSVFLERFCVGLRLVLVCFRVVLGWFQKVRGGGLGFFKESFKGVLGFFVGEMFRGFFKAGFRWFSGGLYGGFLVF